MHALFDHAQSGPATAGSLLTQLFKQKLSAVSGATTVELFILEQPK
jgi:hypothetical protein